MKAKSEKYKWNETEDAKKFCYCAKMKNLQKLEDWEAIARDWGESKKPSKNALDISLLSQ